MISHSTEHLEPIPSPICHVLPTSWWDNWLAGKSPRLIIGVFFDARSILQKGLSVCPCVTLCYKFVKYTVVYSWRLGFSENKEGGVEFVSEVIFSRWGLAY